MRNKLFLAVNKTIHKEKLYVFVNKLLKVFKLSCTRSSLHTGPYRTLRSARSYFFTYYLIVIITYLYYINILEEI